VKLFSSVILAVLMLAAVSATNAGYVSGTTTTVTGVSVYSKGSVAGDLIVLVANPVAGCEAGYYVLNDTEGKNQIMSLALSAYHAKSNVIIYGYDSPRWAGSGGNFCEVEGFHII
jgi:hypothetical protein